MWLRYPDKYYIYKYSEVRAVARELESDFMPKKGYSTDNIIGSFNLYNEICDCLALDGELVDMLKSSLTENCYPTLLLKHLPLILAFISVDFILQKTESDYY